MSGFSFKYRVKFRIENGSIPRKCALGLAAGLELLCIYLLSVYVWDERQFVVEDNAQELSFLHDRNV